MMGLYLQSLSQGCNQQVLWEEEFNLKDRRTFRNVPGVRVSVRVSVRDPKLYAGVCSKLHFSGSYAPGAGVWLVLFVSGLLTKVNV